MPQGVLPFKYECEQTSSGLTALAGLPLYLDLARVAGLAGSLNKHLGVRAQGQGWSDSEVVLSLVLLNLAGGNCVDDLDILEKDDGFCRVLRKTLFSEGTRKQRREQARRWRKGKQRNVPSPSSVFRYLEAFSVEEQQSSRQLGKAFIPTPNKHLRGFSLVNREMLAFAQANAPQKVATLDMDATLIETYKSDALYCYKGYKAYQPLNTWWAEQKMFLHTEFRDGNVPAGYEQTRVLQDALACLPQGVETVRLRSDTAGYQHELLRYCARGEDKRFGRIQFAIGCDVTTEFKKAVAAVPEEEWKPFTKRVNGRVVHTGKQWAEVCFVPNAIGNSKNGPEYRYIATRRCLEEQLLLPGVDQERVYPFPTIQKSGKRYKIHGAVTNMNWPGQELLEWLYQRCGKSEEAHGALKTDLSGGVLPSGEFGANAAWWWVSVISFNLNALMKSLALGLEWASSRLKALRFGLINVPARVLTHARTFLVRLCQGHPAYELFLAARRRIFELFPAPG